MVPLTEMKQVVPNTDMVYEQKLTHSSGSGAIWTTLPSGLRYTTIFFPEPVMKRPTDPSNVFLTQQHRINSQSEHRLLKLDSKLDLALIRQVSQNPFEDTER